jgi:hypothetical protein
MDNVQNCGSYINIPTNQLRGFSPRANYTDRTSNNPLGS